MKVGQGIPVLLTTKELMDLVKALPFHTVKTPDTVRVIDPEGNIVVMGIKKGTVNAWIVRLNKMYFQESSGG